MAGIKLVEFEDGLRVFASSGMEARFMHEEIFRDGCYDVVALPAQPLVVDVGANIGMFSLFVKLRYPDASVLAFEPVAENTAVLRRNIELHQLDGVVVHEVALGSGPERDVPFTYYPALPGNSTRYPAQKQQTQDALGRIYSAAVARRLYRGQTMAVQVEKLSAYLHADRPVDLLKVDAEGAELDVLLGIDAVHWPLIRHAILEVHDQDGRLAQVRDLLSEHGLSSEVELAPMADEATGGYIVRASRC
jgi:FkbM family methyltransferase